MKWTATIPRKLPRHLRQYQERIVWIEGPSHNFWLTNPEIYFEKVDCDATKTAHLKSNAKMEQIGTDDLTTHYALLFPKGTLLVNRAFSGDAQGTVEKYIAPLKHSAANNDVGTEIYGMAVYWIISEKFTGQRIKPKGKKFDIKALYS